MWLPSRYVEKSSDVNCVPLSDTITLGNSCVAKISLNTLIVQCVVVECISLTSGHLL